MSYTDDQIRKTKERLEDLRKEKKLSFGQLSALLEQQNVLISHTNLKNYEINDELHPLYNRTRGMSLENFVALADIFDVSVDYLLGRSNSKKAEYHQMSEELCLSDETIDLLKAMIKEDNSSFWHTLDKLVSGSRIIIDRPKGTTHPRYPEVVYPLDYGYLASTTSMDGGGIDIWQGSNTAQNLDAIICTVDLKKRDAEIKLLVGCTDDEKAQAYQAHNNTEFMKGILIRRS